MTDLRELKGGLPCLPVDEVELAAEYYQRFLGFRLVATVEDPPTAIVRRDDASILLRRAEASDPARLSPDREVRAWDVVVLAADLDAAFEDLSCRGVLVRSPILPHPLLGRAFTINDRFGNALTFCQAPGHVLAALKRRVRAGRQRVQSAQFTRAATAELRPHLEEFRRFYNELPNKKDIFYMFFTGGLVHWAAKAASYVPSDVNLVLLGSNLSTEERAWVTENLRRPLHHIDVHTNDWAVWDFLFDVNNSNFGWLDIDCLVLNDAIFSELTAVPRDAAVNCAWSYDSGFGFRIANTYLVFINVDAIRALRSRGIPVRARPHDWRGGDRSAQAGKRCFYRIPSGRERREMLKVVPPDHRGRPQPPGSHAFFDTLSVYQIVARAMGFRTNQVRDLDNPMLGPVEPGERLEIMPQGMSDELLHVGGISYYQAHFRDPTVRTRYLAADYVTLATWAPRLPLPYQTQLAAVADELRSFGLEPESAAVALGDYLQSVGGLSAGGAARALQVAHR